jgi:hypothetical protein
VGNNQARAPRQGAHVLALPTHSTRMGVLVKFMYAFPKNALSLLFENVLLRPQETFCKLYYRSSRDKHKDRVLMICVASLGPTETTKDLLLRAQAALEDELGYFLVKAPQPKYDGRETPLH